MTTVDQFLIKILNSTTPTIEDYLSKKDSRVLRSIGSIVTGPNFITENQSKLLFKILQENREKIPVFDEDISTVLDKPQWSKFFRQIETVKKMYISQGLDQEPLITIEFTFSSIIRKKLQEITKKINGLTTAQNGKLYQSDLNEQNVVILVEALEPLDFAIDEKLKNYYNTIKSWSKDEVKNQFLLTNITHQNFQKSITADLGLSTAIDQNIINDRSMRYQYMVEKSEKNPENLTEKLANRKTFKVWVDKKETGLDEILSSLLALKRFPVLVVFDSTDTKKCKDELENLTKNLEKNGIFDDVGIYFRLDNDATGKEFNQYIANKKLNCQLDSNTKVVGVQNTKIPKFLLKSGWKPMSVISIGNPLRHSKTAIYANCCDLIISYTEQEPILEGVLRWE